MAKNLVIGIGNVILSDDGVGPYVVRRAGEILVDLNGHVDFKENYSGGFDLLYDIEGYDNVLIIDSISTGKFEPGTCITYNIENLDRSEQKRLVESHGISLPAVLEVGRKCGYKMPEKLLIFGIESEDVSTFSEKLTVKVEACVDDVVDRIKEILLRWIEAEVRSTKLEVRS